MCAENLASAFLPRRTVGAALWATRLSHSTRRTGYPHANYLPRTIYRFQIVTNPEQEYVYDGGTWGGSMPVQYCIDPERRVVITSLAGVVTEEELLDLCSNLANDARFSPHISQLIEVDQGASAVLHYSDLSAVRDKDPFSRESLRAIVVHSPVDFGNARMYEMLWSGHVQVFTSVAEAMEFLGLSGE